jgi:hypothetical protein
LQKDWINKIELFIISHNLLEFLSEHCILPYLFANTLFKFNSIGSEIMINDAEILYLLQNLENFVINTIFDQSLKEYLQ